METKENEEACSFAGSDDEDSEKPTECFFDQFKDADQPCIEDVVDGSGGKNAGSAPKKVRKPLTWRAHVAKRLAVADAGGCDEEAMKKLAVADVGVGEEKSSEEALRDAQDVAMLKLCRARFRKATTLSDSSSSEPEIDLASPDGTEVEDYEFCHGV